MTICLKYLLRHYWLKVLSHPRYFAHIFREWSCCTSDPIVCCLTYRLPKEAKDQKRYWLLIISFQYIIQYTKPVNSHFSCTLIKLRIHWISTSLQNTGITFQPSFDQIKFIFCCWLFTHVYMVSNNYFSIWYQSVSSKVLHVHDSFICSVLSLVHYVQAIYWKHFRIIFRFTYKYIFLENC